MMGHSGANLVPVIASNRWPLHMSATVRISLTALCPVMHKEPADAWHCNNRCGKESFPERAEKTASSIKFHGGSFITGYTGEILKQVIACSPSQQLRTRDTGSGDYCNPPAGVMGPALQAAAYAICRR